MNMKKTAVVIAAIVLSATLAHATLIDLTLGGFDLTKPFPKVVADFFGQYYTAGQKNLAGANIVNGQPVWSPFTIFNSDHFGISLNADGTGAGVSGNLIGTGFFGQFVLVESRALIANLYRVSGRDRFDFDGFVNVNGGTIPVSAVIFAGNNRIPDSGSTLMLLAGAVAVVIFLCRRICT
jgi:hypothetical protein